MRRSRRSSSRTASPPRPDLSPFERGLLETLPAGAAVLHLDATYGRPVAGAWPFPDRSVDAVAMFGLLHLLPEDARRQAYAEILRILRPGGILALSVPTCAPPFTPGGITDELLTAGWGAMTVRRDRGFLRTRGLGVLARAPL